MNLYIGYDPATDTSILLTVHDDGTHKVATRPGQDATDVTWSPEVTLAAVPA
jgi:hypothetical protein